MLCNRISSYSLMKIKLPIIFIHISKVYFEWYKLYIQFSNVCFTSICFSHLQEVLRDVPDYNERAKVLQNHKNKLEALLSPTLVQIFNKHDLGKTSGLPNFVIFFCLLDIFHMYQYFFEFITKSGNKYT